MLDFISTSGMQLSVIYLDDRWQEKLISLKSTSQLPIYVFIHLFVCLFIYFAKH